MSFETTAIKRGVKRRLVIAAAVLGKDISDTINIALTRLMTERGVDLDSLATANNEKERPAVEDSKSSPEAQEVA